MPHDFKTFVAIFMKSQTKQEPWKEATIINSKHIYIQLEKQTIICRNWYAYPLLCIVNVAKTEIIFLQQIQGLAHLIEDALSFNVPLYFQGANSHKQKGGVNEIIFLLNYEKQPSPKHVTTVF